MKLEYSFFALLNDHIKPKTINKVIKLHLKSANWPSNQTEKKQKTSYYLGIVQSFPFFKENQI